MIDGWISVDLELPKVGDNVELRMSEDQFADTGTWMGSARILHPVDDDWQMTLPDGTVVWVRYWRKVQWAT